MFRLPEQPVPQFIPPGAPIIKRGLIRSLCAIRGRLAELLAEGGRPFLRLFLSSIFLLAFSLFLLKLIRLHNVSSQPSYYFNIHFLSLIFTAIFFRRFITSTVTICIDIVADVKYTQHNITDADTLK